MYSDNGLNFVGAKEILKPCVEELTADPVFKQKLAERGIEWYMMPPYGPHFGGIHESLVKSAKRAINAAMEWGQQRRLLTEGELRSLLSEAMGFLNARPLTRVSEDPQDLEPLTPNHFLLGRPNVSVPPKAHKASKYRDTYDFVQSMANHMWKRWTEEYLPTLLARAKWTTEKRNLAVDDVVLLVEPNLPRGMWLLGRVTKVFPNKDGLVRKATVQTKDGEYERPISRICVLEAAKKF